MQTVLRFQPIERRGIGGIGIHNARGYSQENLPDHIDVSRSHLNKVLAGPATEDIPAAMKDAIAGIPVARKMKDPSKDLVMAECLLSASPEFFQQKGATEKWTRQSVKWLKAEFGDKLLSAVLHMDEQTSHIHAVIRVDEEKQRVHPVTKELMPAKKVLCYSDRFMDRKEVLTRARIEGRSHLDTKLGLFQTRYADAVSSLGLSRGRESARTKDKDLHHTTTQEWRDMQQLQTQVQQLKREEGRLKNKVAVLGGELTDIGAKKLAAEKSLMEYSSQLGQVRGQSVQIQKERDALAAALAAEKKGFTASVDKLQAEATEKIRPLLAEEKRLEASLVDLRTRYGIGVKKTEAQQAELAGLEKSLADKSAELKKIGAQIEDQGHIIEAGKEVYEDILKKVNELAGSGKELEARISELEKQDMPDPVWDHLVAACELQKAREYVFSLPEDEVSRIGRQVEKEAAFIQSYREHHGQRQQPTISPVTAVFAIPQDPAEVARMIAAKAKAKAEAEKPKVHKERTHSHSMGMSR
jgi:hypothetical protein